MGNLHSIHLHRSANNGFVFVVRKRKIISGVIFDVESESEIRISLSRQDFEIFEIMCSKNGVFRYIWGYVQGERNFFGFFSQMSLFSTTLSLQNELLNSHERFFFSQRYGQIKFWHLSEQPYEHSHWLFGAYHFAFENLSWKFMLAGFDDLWIWIYSSDPRMRKIFAPIMDPTSSWFLPRSTARSWLNEEDAMSSWDAWWEQKSYAFWDHWFTVRKLTFPFLRWRIQNGGSKFTKLNDFALKNSYSGVSELLLTVNSYSQTIKTRKHKFSNAEWYAPKSQYECS